ncbi:MAG: hypothetical protein WBQ69_06535 [Gallionella sp.]
MQGKTRMETGDYSGHGKIDAGQNFQFEVNQEFSAAIWGYGYIFAFASVTLLHK